MSIERDFGYVPWHPIVEAYRAYQKMPYDRPTWDDWRGRGRPSPGLSFHTRNDRTRMLEEIEFLAHLGGRVLVVVFQRGNRIRLPGWVM